MPGATLIVRVDQQGFWFQEPLGEPLQLERYTLKKQEAVQRLVSMRCAGLLGGALDLGATKHLRSPACCAPLSASRPTQRNILIFCPPRA